MPDLKLPISEPTPEPIVKQPATKLLGKCPDCGTPMRRYVTIGAKMAITEAAVYCPCCRGFMKRSITYGKETFAVCPDPRRDKLAPLPVVEREA